MLWHKRVFAISVIGVALLGSTAAGALGAARLTRIHVPARYGRVMQITSGADGAIWGSTDEGGYLLAISPSGHVIHAYRPKGLWPGPVAIGADDNVWFFAYTNGPRGGVTATLGYITHSGRAHEFPLRPVGFSVITSLVAGPDGAMWFSDDEGQVGRLTEQGRLTMVPAPPHIDSPQLTDGPDGRIWASGQSTGIYEREAHDRWQRVTNTQGGSLIFDSSGTGWTAYTDTIESDSRRLRAVPTGTPPVNLSAATGRGIWLTRQKAVQTVTPSGAVATFRYPSLTFGGFGASQTAGPDGRLWISTLTYNTLWAWTPPAPVRPTAPTLSISKASVSPTTGGRRATLTITLTCHGQPGRFCAGTITAASLRAHPYALAPQTVLTLRLSLSRAVSPGARIQVIASNRDPIAHRTRSVSTVAKVPAP